MPDYTIKNFMDLPDLAADRPGDAEARFGRSHIDSEHLGVSYFRYGAGFRSPVAHRHREQEEAYVVVSGSGKVKLDDDVLDLKLWDVIRVSPNVVRAFEGGPDGIEIVAVGADRPEGGDGEIVEDFWGE
jgi:mannose-6-phosphate isomerase-like protein (cupin superfamily)